MAVDMQLESPEGTNANTNNSVNDNSSQSTIFNPQNSNGSDNDFPAVNSSEPQTENSFKKIEDEAFVEILKQSLNNDIRIGELLQHYSDSFKDKQEQKAKLKNRFFYWIMILLSVVTAGCFALPICAIFFDKDMATIIVSASASVIEFSIAFLKLPKIVAEYLFDKGEDKAMAKFVSDTHKYTLKRTNRHK